MSADQATLPCATARDAPWDGLKRLLLPMLLIDVRHKRLVDANAAGARQWCGLDRLPQHSLPLDAAMPALHTMLAWMSAPQVEPGLETLLFWSPRGLLRLSCRATRIFPDLGQVAVAVVPSAPATGLVESQPVAAQANARLAHELRTPIGAVVAYAEAIAQEHFGALGNERYREYAQNLRQSALHALAVVEAMLAAHGPQERGKREHVFRDVDPALITQSCITVMRPMALRADVRLEARLPDRLPRVVADEVSLRQMLLNLLTNAIKFARPGDRVSLAVTYAGNGALTFEVEDTGPGVAASLEQAQWEGANARGLGLGLPITRELAEANGAVFEVESERGAGTRARISFGPSRVVPV